MARPVKKLLRNERLRGFACWLGAHYIRFVHATCRWQRVRPDVPEALWQAGTPFILCFWHGRLLMIPHTWNYTHTIRTLVSDHPDGRLIARTVTHFGIRSIIGSATRGGARAFREMMRALKAGQCIGITPDGPRGPRMRARDGACVLARRAGVPVVPVAYSVRRRRVLGTWDRFVIAWPFSRGAFVWGEPLHFGPHALGAAADGGRQALEDALNAVTAEADCLCGHAPIDPAPLDPASASAPAPAPATAPVSPP